MNQVQLHEELRYAASPAQVAAMLADEEFVHAKCRRMHSLEHQVQVEGEPNESFTVTTVRTMSTDRFPDLARSFVGRHVHLRQVDRWLRPDDDGERNGSISLTLVGLPVRLEGQYQLRSWGRETRILLTAQLHASVPFVGRQLERMAAPAITAGVRREQEAGADWLARG